MNVLIVDDEPIVRMGMRTLIDWEDNGLTLYAEAADGIEAWEMLQRGEVDILVTDLLMPRMDGLELIRAIKRDALDVAVVVLSCLDDFTYVKEAMKLGAREYILKPTMEPETLLAVLQTTQAELVKDRLEQEQSKRWQTELQQSKQAQLGLRLEQYITTGQDDSELEDGWLPPGKQMLSLCVFVGHAKLMPRLGWLFEPLKELHAAVRINEQLVMLLFAVNATVSRQERYQIGRALLERVEQYLLEAGVAPEQFFIGVGAQLHCLAEVPAAASMHERQIHGLFYGGTADMLLEVSPNKQPAPTAALLPQAEKTDFLRAAAAGNPAAAADAMQRIVTHLSEHKPPIHKVNGYLYELLGLAVGFVRDRQSDGLDEFESQYVSFERIQSFIRLSDVERYLQTAVRELMAIRCAHGGEHGVKSPFVRKAMQFMRDNYRSNMTTQDIAEHVKLSRSYLSDLYSKETGESLSESLLRIRMDEAMRLLQTGEKKVYEVAEAVGFQDAKAFAKTFKKLFGVTPKEFEAAQR